MATPPGAGFYHFQVAQIVAQRHKALAMAVAGGCWSRAKCMKLFVPFRAVLGSRAEVAREAMGDSGIDCLRSCSSAQKDQESGMAKGAQDDSRRVKAVGGVQQPKSYGASAIRRVDAGQAGSTAALTVSVNPETRESLRTIVMEAWTTTWLASWRRAAGRPQMGWTVPSEVRGLCCAWALLLDLSRLREGPGSLLGR